MEESFLSDLIDTSGNYFLFGKNEPVQRSFFFGNFSKKDSVSTRYSQLYYGHELRPRHPGEVVRKNIAPDWLFPFILIILIVFTWLRLFYNKFFSQLVQAFLNSNIANQIVRDENILVQRASLYLSIVFNLVAALLLYLLSMRYGWSMGGIGGGFSRFAFFVMIVSVAYAFKFLILKISGWLFEQEREMATYIFNIFLINNILGIALFPIICLIAYNESVTLSWFISLPVILIAAAFVWRIVRGLQIGLSMSSFSPLYLFLYLCTLEIAPLVVVLRIIL